MCAYIRAATFSTTSRTSFLDRHQTGLAGIPWKAARIGERKSPWVAAALIAMAVHILFLK